MKTTTTAKTYDPVERCIYCGRSEPEVPRLTIEHIIPYSLGGLWELPAASCDGCANQTKQFEQIVARDCLKPFRAKHRFKSRRKMPTEFPLRIQQHDGVYKDIPVSADHHHGTITLWGFPPPRILLGLAEEKSPTHQGKPWTFPSTEELYNFHKPYGGKGFTGSPFNFAAMARLVAKIAHSYVVAEVGYDNLEPMLRPIILGESDNYFWLVGGEFDPPPMVDELHTVNWETCRIEDTSYIFCRVRLFSCLGSPVYYAVVGKLRPQVSD